MVGLVVEKLVLRKYMRNFLQERNAVVKEIAESAEWGKYLALPER